MSDIKKVISKDYCIGCGVCSVVSDNFSIEMNSKGQYQAKFNKFKNNNLKEIDNICPFTRESKNEDQLSDIFLDNSIAYKNNIGRFLANYSGYVKDNIQRESSSSGGILSWLLIKLLESKKIDGVIHVGDFLDNSEVLMGYRISFSKEQIINNKKSRYYPIEMSQTLKKIKEDYPNKKFAIVGIPCFIKAIRLLQLQDSFYMDSIKYTIGIVCGHLKTKFFAESYALEVNINPKKIKNIDFRYYQPSDTEASNYSVKIIGENFKNSKKIQVIRNNNEFYASNWGHGMFKYNACEFCDDVLAETADIVFGDAWLPEYLHESKGTNIITVRNLDLNNIILNNNNNELHLEILTAEKIIESQKSGIRHRTEGLKFRLYKNRFKWTPKKRLSPDNKNLSIKRKNIYNLRTKILKKSNLFFEELNDGENFNIFRSKIDKYIKKYNCLYSNKKDDNIIILKIKKIYWKITDTFFVKK